MMWQSIKLAIQSIFSNRLRSMLTMLGMIIGVTSLVVLVSIVNGATDSVTSAISDMGNNLLTIRISDDKNQPYSIEEILDFSKEEIVGYVAPYTQSSYTVKKGRTSSSITVYGTSADYDDIQKLTLSGGRFLNGADLDNHTYVAVINKVTAQTLFNSTNVVGEEISLNGYPFTVIGVTEEKENAVGNTTERLEAYIPYTALTRTANMVRSISDFYITAGTEDQIDRLEQVMTKALYTRFKSDSDAFTITSNSTLLETMSSVNDTMKWMLGGIAAISLIVGGIGIMNIMLVSVTERTREIGVRKAIGANRKHIMMQFMTEALLVSLIGCVIGIVLSLLIVIGINYFCTDLSASISFDVVAIAVGFSLGIGVVFGSYPAYKAAAMSPIEALRYT